VYATPSPSTLGPGLVDIRLKNQKTSRNSSELHPCCGIEYNHENECAILAIADGSLHVVGNLSGTPKYDNSVDSGLSSNGLSALARSSFSVIEGKGVTDAVTGRISGMTSVCNGSILLWLSE